MDLKTHLTQELVRWMVGRQIFCPLTQRVLDIRTAVQIWRGDDLVIVVSPEGFARFGDCSFLADPAGATAVHP